MAERSESNRGSSEALTKVARDALKRRSVSKQDLRSSELRLAKKASGPNSVGLEAAYLPVAAYSVRRLSIGLAKAALTAWKPIVTSVITMIETPATTNTMQPISTR
jgi:hypothetical protein